MLHSFYVEVVTWQILIQIGPNEYIKLFQVEVIMSPIELGMDIQKWLTDSMWR